MKIWEKLSSERLWQAFTELIEISNVILTCIEKVGLPEIRSNICELTDSSRLWQESRHNIG